MVVGTSETLPCLPILEVFPNSKFPDRLGGSAQRIVYVSCIIPMNPHEPLPFEVLRNLENFDLTACQTVPIKEHPTG